MPHHPKKIVAIVAVVVLVCLAVIITPIFNASTEYKNTTYGFVFALPESWKGYTVIDDIWTGSNWNVEPVQKESGPKISIRHPQWTAEIPRQDIPILIFTPAEWDLIVREKMGIGGAPIPPSELGRNATYVFALPARYNFAFPAGFEEVDEIMKGNPLRGL